MQNPSADTVNIRVRRVGREPPNISFTVAVRRGSADNAPSPLVANDLDSVLPAG